MSTPILVTKLYIPPPRPKVVLRLRLIERLNEGHSSGCKLTHISASAGFGKTTLVSELQALAMLFLHIYKNGFSGIARIFFGAWLFPLGYLVFKSGFLPRIFGAILMIHCVAWLMTALQFFLFPGFSAITYVSYPIGFISEFGLSSWLLIMGAKDQKPILVEG